MTVYARSDIAAVNISTTHGGCGETHSRPAPGGIPAKIWSLTCHGGCEDALRSDAHWAGTPHTIPETPDEVAIRTDVEKRGQVEQQTSMAQALNDLAKLGALPSVLAQLMGHLNPGADKVEAATLEQELQVCRNGHMNQHHVKFCGECGADMQDAVNKQPIAALSAPETVSAVGDGETDPAAETQAETADEDLDDLSYTQLKEIAKAEGLAIVPSRAGQLDIVKKAHTK